MRFREAASGGILIEIFDLDGAEKVNVFAGHFGSVLEDCVASHEDGKD